MSPLAQAGEFSAYGLSHRVILLLFAVGAVLLVVAGRRRGHTAAARRSGRFVALLVLAAKVGVLGYMMMPQRWSVEQSLPLELSDLAGLVAVYALFSQRHWAFAVTYYWGLVLSTQALFTPVLQAEFPHENFFTFWGFHLFVIWVAIYLTWGLRMQPNWYSYGITVAITAGWAVTAFTVNALTGSNYGFLNRKPDTASVLDVLGPWPWYLLPVVGLVLGVWALMTWPWTHARIVRRARARQLG